MSETFEHYPARLFPRHNNGATSASSTAGDVVMASGLAAGLVERRLPVALVGLTFGFAVAAAAHLFQPRTLRDEVVAVLRHQLWAVKAESQRVFGGANWSRRSD